ncbi:S41 family peptidase [Colwellia psychrerythraea]|uniref:Peptidase S41 n=1 Tax=Colwellia psychrerythraea TaxID=28229 RepID=A0A099K960_COLPS|nr:S41 family peptidase [Colwellia psychrerythraea]KGJ86830.1 peptidase S41 [Colwellia psychrerythraea]
MTVVIDKDEQSTLSKKSLLLLNIALPLVMLTGCGGGSGGTTKVTQVPVSKAVTESTWQQDQFQPSSNFVAQCKDPRSGSSPITNITYPDKQGSELLEKHWQRAFTHETYLWYKDVIDKDPKNFSLINYFDQLKTSEVTDSGALKDKFHWMEPTSGVEERTQLGVSYGYGIDYDKQSSIAPPRSWQVKNITPNTQAMTSGVSRGSKLLEIDGVDFVNTTSQSDIDIMENALFSRNEGESHSFKFIGIDNVEYDVTLQTAAIEGVPLQLAKTIDTPQGKVGYLLLNSFNNSTVEKDLFDEFNQFSADQITDLVVDLRYNGGGFLALSSQLAYMVAGKDVTENKIYEKTIYNDKKASNSFPFIDVTIDLRRLIGGDSVIQTDQPLPTLNLARVYVLTTSSSCSASESFINSLIGVGIEVIQIGETTCGKPYGFVSQDNCGSTYFTVQFKGENDAGFGDYADGLVPAKLPEAGKLYQVQGCPIEEDYLHSLGDEQEILLASALYYQTNNTCPVINEQPVKLSRKSISDFSSPKSMLSQPSNSVDYFGPKLDTRTPLQDAIIDDMYFDKFRHIRAGKTQ